MNLFKKGEFKGFVEDWGQGDKGGFGLHYVRSHGEGCDGGFGTPLVPRKDFARHTGRGTDTGYGTGYGRGEGSGDGIGDGFGKSDFDDSGKGVEKDQEMTPIYHRNGAK